MDQIDFRQTELSLNAMKFMATFVRLEFALKENGYCAQSRWSNVQWDKVANELGSTFYETVVSSTKAETILQHPPKKQIAQHQILQWEEQAAPTNVSELLEAVRRIRNNQFHGGKSGHPDDAPEDRQRREKLIAEAQWVIELILRRMPIIRASFEGRY